MPSTSVITAALRAARRVNDFPTAVRVFEGKSSTHLHKHTQHTQTRSTVGSMRCGTDFSTAGIRAKVENVHQYNEYLTELQSMREEMGVVLKEDLFPNTMGGERTNPA